MDNCLKHLSLQIIQIFVYFMLWTSGSKSQLAWINQLKTYTPCSEKNTHSCFLLYFHGKYSDFHKNFQRISRM